VQAVITIILVTYGALELHCRVFELAVGTIIY